MTLIGLCGRRRSGKDTVCQIIQKLLPHRRVKRFAFADALKWEVAKAWGTTPDHIEANKEPFRPLLQAWGELRRQQDEGYWIRRVEQGIRSYMQSLPEHLHEDFVAVVTDVRHVSEALWVESARHGRAIRIYRPSIQTCELTDSHISETALDDFELACQVANDGTLEQLEQEVAYVLAEMGLLAEEGVAK